MKSCVGGQQHQDGQQHQGGGEHEGRGWVQVLYSANAKRRVQSECVRSNINFHPRNQDVDFDMLEMFF